MRMIPPLEALLAHFPHEHIRIVQRDALTELANTDKSSTFELPTGSGKSAIGMAVLRALSAEKKPGNFYVTPTKAQLAQLRQMFPDLIEVMGRSEYECLYYTDRDKPDITAAESPCYMLDCPHRVNTLTGEVQEEGATPCPYFMAKHQALKQAESGGIVVCTTAFFVLNRLLLDEWRNLETSMVIIDEVHRLAATMRNLYEHTISDYHLERVLQAMRGVAEDTEVEALEAFLSTFVRIAHRTPSQRQKLLKNEEIEELLATLKPIRTREIERAARRAVKEGLLDPMSNRTELNMLQSLAHSIPRLITSLRYSLDDQEDKRPLNYVVAYYYRKDDPDRVGKKTRIFLTLKAYYVRPLIQKAIGKKRIAYSATIGDPKILGFETGINGNFRSFGSNFAVKNTRIFMPTDTPDLARRGSSEKSAKSNTAKAMRIIANAAFEFTRHGHRSLIVVTSNDELGRMQKRCEDVGLDVITYHNNGTTARDALQTFRDGNGSVLVGTSSQYSDGIDLPDGLAPVIFFLRPGYPRPDSPESQFEEGRFSNGHVWALRQYRVLIEALQVRGRNIRSVRDRGVCFFISQQFRKFLYPGLPEWLRPAYRRGLTMDESVREALQLFNNE